MARKPAHTQLALLETPVLERCERERGLHIDGRLTSRRTVAAAALLLAAAIGTGWYLHNRDHRNPALTLAFLPGQQIYQTSPVDGHGPWTYGGQWMFNYTGGPVTLNRVTLLGKTPGFHVTRIGVALDRKRNDIVGPGFPPTWAPHVRPVDGTVVPSLGLRQTANLNQTAEILIGFTLDPSYRSSGFRSMQIDYTQGGHAHTYVLDGSFSACPHIPPVTEKDAVKTCRDLPTPWW